MNTIEFVNELDVHRNKLYGFAMTLTKNNHDADDLMQETTFKAFKNLNQFKAGSNFKAWITMIMRNTFINNYRKEKKKVAFQERIDQDYIANIIYNQGESNQMVDEIKNYIEALNEDLKIAFLMRYSGYKYEEIAEHLELPLGTVKSKIFYARKQLKSMIKKGYQINHFSEALN